MRGRIELIIVAAALAAGPAAAQNAADPAANNAVEMPRGNEAQNTQVAVPPPSPADVAATPGAQEPQLPPTAPETGGGVIVQRDRRFPWGLLGLLGLIGLLGRRRSA